MSLRSFATSFLDTGGPVPFFTHMTNNDASPLHDYDNWAVFVHKLWGADDAEMLGHRLESTLAARNVAIHYNMRFEGPPPRGVWIWAVHPDAPRETCMPPNNTGYTVLTWNELLDKCRESELQETSYKKCGIKPGYYTLPKSFTTFETELKANPKLSTAYNKLSKQWNPPSYNAFPTWPGPAKVHSGIAARQRRARPRHRTPELPGAYPREGPSEKEKEDEEDFKHLCEIRLREKSKLRSWENMRRNDLLAYYESRKVLEVERVDAGAKPDFVKDKDPGKRFWYGRWSHFTTDDWEYMDGYMEELGKEGFPVGYARTLSAQTDALIHRKRKHWEFATDP